MSSIHFDNAFLVLYIMSCLSFALCLFLHFKNRALLRLPKNPNVNVSDRTFSVFDPYPEHRKAIHNYITLLPFVVLVGTLTIAYLVLNIFAMEFVLSFVTFTVCLGLMMVDEVFEIYKNANMLVKAVDSGADFGVGDLTALLMTKKILPKLRAYYLFLSITFLASIVALPHIVPADVLALNQAVGAIFEFSASAGPLAPFGIIFLFAATEVVIYVTVTKVKSRIFGFSSSQPLISATSAKARMSVSVETLNHVFEANPEQITY